MKFSMQRFFFALAVCLLLLGCTRKPSDSLQQSERFAEVYAKILIASKVETDSTLQRIEDANVRFAPADSVLSSLGIERRQFEAAIKYFSERPELWKEVYAHVVKIVEAQINNTDERGKSGNRQRK